MISVENSGIGYKLKVSDPGFGRYSLQARNKQEAVNAVAHYIGLAHTGECASCRKIQEEQAEVERKVARRERRG